MQTLYLSSLKKENPIALKRALEILKDFDGFTLNEVEGLASGSKTDDDYYKAHTDDNSKQNAEEEGESILSHICKGKDGYIWQANPRRRRRTHLRDIVVQLYRTKNVGALAHSPQKVFDLFINDRLITINSKWTNQKIRQVRDRLKSRQEFAYDTENIEIKALIEILFLASI